MKRLLLLAACLLPLLTGCVAAIGNSGPPRGGATLGQQLLDLQKAYEAGALTQAEYATQKNRLLGHK